MQFLPHKLPKKNLKTQSFKSVSFVCPAKKIVDSGGEKKKVGKNPLFFLENSCGSEFEDSAKTTKYYQAVRFEQASFCITLSK